MIIRLGSQRAFHKVERTLNRKIKGLWNAYYLGSYGLTEVTDQEFELIKNIKMVRKTRLKREDLIECISWKSP